MQNEILELYNLGLEKYAGDESAAKEFVIGFMKEAFTGAQVVTPLGRVFTESAVKGIGAGVAGLGLGLGIHGLSSFMNQAGGKDLRMKFQSSFQHALATNPLLENADRAKIDSYGETVFKFAPHVAADPNLLSMLLAHIVQGEGVDVTILKTITDLEDKLVQTRKNSLFSPKTYM